MALVVLMQALSVEKVDVRYCRVCDFDTESFSGGTSGRWNILRFDAGQILRE